MLQAMSSLRKNWATQGLEPYANSCLRLRRSASPADLLYHTDRGRVVWFPSSFTLKKPFIRSSGCYHGNLTLLHLQTEALLQCVALRKDYVDRGAVPEEATQLATYSVDAISNLYSSDDSSYRSSSVRAYLDETHSQKTMVESAMSDLKTAQKELKYQPSPT